MDKKENTGARPVLLVIFGIAILAIAVWGAVGAFSAVSRSDTPDVSVTQTQTQTREEVGSTGSVLDVDALIEDLIARVDFDGQMTELDDAIAQGMVETADGTSLRFYMGSGTSADEILVMTAQSESAAKKNQEYAAAHLADTQSAFADYIPAEANKIDGAVNIRCGDYVIVCVTSDAQTAEEIIRAAIENA